MAHLAETTLVVVECPAVIQTTPNSKSINSPSNDPVGHDCTSLTVLGGNPMDGLDDDGGGCPPRGGGGGGLRLRPSNSSSMKRDDGGGGSWFGGGGR